MATLRQQAALAASVLVSALLAGAAGAESPMEPVAQPAFSPGTEALRVELALQYDRNSAERSFYEARGYLPVWLTVLLRMYALWWSWPRR